MTNLETLALKALQADMDLKEATRLAKEAKDAVVAELIKLDRFNPDTKVAGPVRLKITPNRFFDVDTAQEFVTEKVLKECEVTKVDPKLLQQHLTPLQREQAMKSYPSPYKIGFDVLTD